MELEAVVLLQDGSHTLVERVADAFVNYDLSIRTAEGLSRNLGTQLG